MAAGGPTRGASRSSVRASADRRRTAPTAAISILYIKYEIFRTQYFEIVNSTTHCPLQYKLQSIGSIYSLLLRSLISAYIIRDVTVSARQMFPNVTYLSYHLREHNYNGCKRPRPFALRLKQFRSLPDEVQGPPRECHSLRSNVERYPLVRDPYNRLHYGLPRVSPRRPRWPIDYHISDSKHN